VDTALKNSSESNIQAKIRLAASRLGYTLWRNNVGRLWTGQNTQRGGDRVVIYGNVRPVNYGLCKGSSDLIGLRPVVITQEMVGTTMAQFVAVEVKNNTGRATNDQKNFLDYVEKNGGLAILARDETDLP